MSNIVHIPERKYSDHADVEAEARAWVIALDGDSPADDQLREFRAWLKRSPRHREAFKAAAQVWGELDRWSEFLYPEPKSDEQSPAVADSPHDRWRQRPALAFASLAALAIAVTLVLTSGGRQREARRFAAEYNSVTGEVKAVSLPDGSDVRLNTQSRIAVAYTSAARIVQLTEGEAYFQVAHNPKQPFVVYAGRYAVKAVGTAFSVQRLADGLELNVTDGRVEVAMLPETIPDRATDGISAINDAVSIVPFTQGQHAILKEDHGELELVQTVSEATMEAELAWRNGLLIFDDDPLEAVVAEINRYTPMRIVIADAGIRDVRIGGYFRVNDVPAILTSMENGFGLHVEQVDDRLIYLSRQAGNQPAP